MAKSRSRSSKSARRRANQFATDRSRADLTGNSPTPQLPPSEGSVATATRSGVRPKVEIPAPHPLADPDAALEAVAQYRAELKLWKSLPFWKRLLTAKPRHPVGV